MQTMQASSSDTALFGHRNKGRKKQDFKPWENPNCNNRTSHPTSKCWSPGGPKHNPDRTRKLNRKKKEKAHKADSDEDNEDEGSTTSLRIHLDRSFVTTQSDSDLLYFSPTDSSTSPTTSQAYIAKGPSQIIIDSGTTSHIHNVRSDFEFIDKDDMNTITGFGDSSVSSSGRGNATVWTKSSGGKNSINQITLKKTMFVPSSNVSLLSVSRFDKAGCRVKFANGRCNISDMKTGETILTGTMQKNLYYLDNISTDTATHIPTKVYHTTNSEITLDLMHRRLGHLNVRAVQKLFKKNMVSGISLSEKHLKPLSAIAVFEVKCNAPHSRNLCLGRPKFSISSTQISGDLLPSNLSAENSTSSLSPMTLHATRGPTKRSRTSKPGIRKLSAKRIENLRYFDRTMAASISLANGNST